MDPALEHRLKRLMLLRVVMVTTLLLIAALVEMVSETLIQANPLYHVIVATYALTLLHVAALRFLGARPVQVYSQVVGDLGMITWLVYLVGGTASQAGFMLLYPIAVLSGGVLLHGRRGMVFALLATLFYGATLWAVRSGLVPPRGLAEVPSLPLKQLLYSIFVVGVSCTTVTLIGGYLSESLHATGQRLRAVADQVADLQLLNRIIVENLQSGLLIADAEQRIVYVNAYGAAVLSRSPFDVRGRFLGEIFAALGQSPDLEQQLGGQGLERAELPYERPDGTRLILGASLSHLAALNPIKGGYLMAFRDLTEIKRLEEEVRIKDKLATMGHMAACLTHEIRNPLAAISGSAQMLMVEPNISGEQQQLLGIITRESRRLSDTLSQFLGQARRPALSPGSADLGPVIAEAVALLRNSSELGPEHRVQFDQDPGPQVCAADPDQIRQVFWNLCRNALEAMPEGGVLRIRLAREGDSVLLSFRDEGRGMGREEQRRIFEPFHSGTGGGTGLGLAIVYQIVQEHRGDITVRSAPHQGTEVGVRLPLVAVSLSA